MKVLLVGCALSLVTAQQYSISSRDGGTLLIGQQCLSGAECASQALGATTCVSSASLGYTACLFSNCVKGFHLGQEQKTCDPDSNVPIGGQCASIANSEVEYCAQIPSNGTITCQSGVCLFKDCLTGFTMVNNGQGCLEDTNVKLGGYCARTEDCLTDSQGQVECSESLCRLTSCNAYSFITNPRGTACVEDPEVTYGNPCAHDSNCVQYSTNTGWGTVSCVNPQGIVGANKAICQLTSCQNGYTLTLVETQMDCVETVDVPINKPCISDHACVHSDIGQVKCLPGTSGNNVCLFDSCAYGYTLQAGGLDCLVSTGVPIGGACINKFSCLGNNNGTIDCFDGSYSGNKTCLFTGCNNGYSLSEDQMTCSENQDVELGYPCAFSRDCRKNKGGDTWCQPLIPILTRKRVFGWNSDNNVCQFSNCYKGYTIGPQNLTCNANENVPINEFCAYSKVCTTDFANNGTVDCLQDWYGDYRCLFTSPAHGYSLYKNKTLSLENTNVTIGNDCAQKADCALNPLGAVDCQSPPGLENTTDTEVCLFQSCIYAYTLSSNHQQCTMNHDVGLGGACVPGACATNAIGPVTCTSPPNTTPPGPAVCLLSGCYANGFGLSPDGMKCLELTNVPLGNACHATEDCALNTNGTIGCFVGKAKPNAICMFTSCVGGFTLAANNLTCTENTGVPIGNLCARTEDCLESSVGTVGCFAGSLGGPKMCLYTSCNNGFLKGLDSKTCTELTNVAINDPCAASADCLQNANGTIGCIPGANGNTVCLFKNCINGFTKSLDSTRCIENTNVPIGGFCASTVDCAPSKIGTVKCMPGLTVHANICLYDSCANGYTLSTDRTTCTENLNVPINEACAFDSSCAKVPNGSVACIPGPLGNNVCLITSCASGYGLLYTKLECRTWLSEALDIAAGDIPTPSMLTPVSSAIERILIGQFGSLLPNAFIFDPAALFFNQIDLSFVPGKFASFVASPFVVGNGLVGGMVALSSTTYDFISVQQPNNIGTDSSYVKAQIDNGFVDIFYVVKASVSPIWVALSLSADASAVMVQVNSAHQVLLFDVIQLTAVKKPTPAPGPAFTVATGSVTLSQLAHLDDGTVAMTDLQFAYRASLFALSLPTCAIACESLIPGFAAFLAKGTPANLYTTCQAIDKTPILDSFNTCAGSCGPADQILVKNFTSKFGPLCKGFIQPAPAITLANDLLSFTLNVTDKLTITMFDYSITDINGVTLAGTNIAKFNQRRDIFNVLSIAFKFSTCSAVTIHMKYGLCDAALTGPANVCSGTLTGHVKSQDLDPTAIQGSGFYGETCQNSVVTNVAPPSDALTATPSVVQLGQTFVLTLSGTKLTPAHKYISKLVIYSSSANLDINAPVDATCSDSSKAWCPVNLGGVEYNCFVTAQKDVDQVITLTTSAGKKVSGCSSTSDLAFVNTLNQYYKIDVTFDANPSGVVGSQFVGRDALATRGTVSVLVQVISPGSGGPSQVLSGATSLAGTSVAVVLGLYVL
ncbi:hypothetical protein BCR33DRAFT_847025 [Rhizoclosmatium globosum]|uniref:EGF-like domain-containing protein n=1 Tax=Rhizoclosmatium globosum TaxID=329046 RepID=A0A1Y2CUA8_9FUNG|nr:hypothetical protein BCR33DRAFT_847025 [Rhizoclosmatium globosum]|eukprot:ORY50582.1 hypothetical protein BCR33DRAFT_847025 [Rhizoclosmatium globosum]